MTLAGEPLRLTSTEYHLLEVLAHNAGRIVENDVLLQRVLGYERGDESESLKVLIYRLRQKIEPGPANPRYVLTERGVSYSLSAAC